MSRKVGWSLSCGILAVGLLVWITVGGSEARRQATVRFALPEPAPDDSRAGLELGVPRIAIPSQATGGEATLGAVLEEYWGARWPSVQEKLIQEGGDPNRPFRLEPWEEVAGELRESFLPRPDEYAKETREFYLEWPQDGLTLKWLKSEFIVPKDFTESDLYKVEAIAAPFNAEIDALAEQYSMVLCQVIEQKWDQGDFIRAPHSTKLVPEVQDASGNFFAKSMASGSGWAVKMTLNKRDYPDLDALKSEMQAKQIERDRALRVRFARWVQ